VTETKYEYEVVGRFVVKGKMGVAAGRVVVSLFGAFLFVNNADKVELVK
jgi:hypothetical protein